jgi:hypothetical protein
VGVEYTKGGMPVILVPDDILEGSGLCRATGTVTTSNLSNGGKRWVNVPSVVSFLGVLLLPFIL